jgi:hypothetical protein
LNGGGEIDKGGKDFFEFQPIAPTGKIYARFIFYVFAEKCECGCKNKYNFPFCFRVGIDLKQKGKLYF